MRGCRVWIVLAASLLTACGLVRDVEQNPLGPATDRGDTTETAAPQIGAAGLGDPYYPGLGNGGYDVDHYDIDLRWDEADGSIDATTTIEATANQDLAQFNLDLYGLEVTTVAIDGSDATFERADGEFEVTPPSTIESGTDFTTTVSYEGVPEPVLDADGFSLGWNSDLEDRGAYVVSAYLGAATWFPANDHPSDKATYAFSLNVPEGLLAAANGELLSETTTEGRATFVWEMDDPVASYLVTVVIGDYEIVTTEGASGVRIRNVFPVDLPEEARASFDRTDDMIAGLAEVIGPYPFDEYGVAVVDDPLSFALETQTLSIFGLGPAPEFIVVHELGHQWFGDSVTLATWNDIWLNEGFATYVQWLWTEIDTGRSAADSARAELGRAGAELDTPPSDPGADDLFAATVYTRGALTLQALRESVGDDDFFTILRTWLERFGGRSASTDDFIELSEEISGVQLDDLFAEWLDAEELPDLPPAAD